MNLEANRAESNGSLHFDVRKLDTLRGIDVVAAAELIEENPVLRHDPLTRRMLENGFVNKEGKYIDPGDFLFARLAILEAEDAESRIALIKKNNRIAFDAATSVIDSDDSDRIVDHPGKTIH